MPFGSEQDLPVTKIFEYDGVLFRHFSVGAGGIIGPCSGLIKPDTHLGDDTIPSTPAKYGYPRTVYCARDQHILTRDKINYHGLSRVVGPKRMQSLTTHRLQLPRTGTSPLTTVTNNYRPGATDH